MHFWTDAPAPQERAKKELAAAASEKKAKAAAPKEKEPAGPKYYTNGYMVCRGADCIGPSACAVTSCAVLTRRRTRNFYRSSSGTQDASRLHEAQASGSRPTPACPEPQSLPSDPGPWPCPMQPQLYVEEQRPAVLEANPGAGFGEVGKLLGAGWKELGKDGQEEYNTRAKVSSSPWGLGLLVVMSPASSWPHHRRLLALGRGWCPN